MIHPEDEDTQRRRRTLQVLTELGVSQRDFSRKTGFSKSQWYAWFSTNRSSANRLPSLQQFSIICSVYNLSPTWILKGIGPKFLQGFDTKNTHQEIITKVTELYELISDID